MKIEDTKFNGIFNIIHGTKKILVTKNLTPGKSFFREKLYSLGNLEFREFNPSRSKLGAAVVKRINFMPIKKGDSVLYLGASHGYTPSYVSDIVGNEGVIFCLDFAQRVIRDLIFVCEERNNMIPLLANAKKPETYKDRITNVDIIYQDVAQKDQVEILFKNLQFLKNKGYVLIAIKSRSIDTTKNPRKVFSEVEEKLKQKLKILESKDLAPFERDHMIFICQKR